MRESALGAPAPALATLSADAKYLLDDEGVEQGVLGLILAAGLTTLQLFPLLEERRRGHGDKAFFDGRYQRAEAAGAVFSEASSCTVSAQARQ